MKKKLLSILLSLALVITMMPMMTMTAFASTSVGTWQDLQSTITGATDAVEIELTGDLTASATTDSAITVESGKNVTIDLKGHTINRNLLIATSDGFVIEVKGNLTIKDSVGEGKITGGHNKESGGGVYVASNGVLTMSNGVISGNAAKENANGKYGAGVYVDQHATFNMTGGKISGNTGGQGAGVYSKGIFTMSGNSEITGNTGTMGGGVGIGGGTFTMTESSKIANNKGTGCGGVYIHTGSFKMTGGTITGNTATGYGGVSIMSSGSFEMTGGMITGNTATGCGGVLDSGTITLGGSANITGNVKGGTIKDGVLTGGTVSNVLLNDTQITLGTKSASYEGNDVAAPTGDFKVGVTTATVPTAAAPVQITTNGTADDVKYFTSDNAGYVVKHNTSGYLELKTITTIADILPKDFPKLVDTLPENLWKNESGVKMLCLPSGSEGYTLLTFNDWDTDIKEIVTEQSLLDKNGNNYSCTNEGVTTTFVFDSNKKLITIEISGISGDSAKFNGIYSPKSSISPTVSLEGWTYGDTAKTPSVSGNAGNGTVTYKYKVKDAADSSYTDEIPSNAGTYVVRAEIPETTEYRAGSATTEFTIAKANQPAPAAGVGYSIDSSLKITITDGYQVSATSEDYTTLVGNDAQLTDGSTYYIRKSENNNYNASAETSFIAKAPLAPTPSEPTIVVPVSGGEEKVEVSATVSGEKATVGDISEKDIEKVVSGDKGDAVVEIDLSGLDKTISEVELPVKTVEKIAEATQASGKEEAGMSVKMSAASVTFDAKATQAMVDQAEGNTIQLVVDDIKTVSLNAVQKEAVEKLDTAIIIDAYLVSNGIKLCTESKNGFAGGKATVALQYEIKNNRTPLNYKVFYVDDNGKLTNLKAKYNEETKSFVFDIEHFSNYAVAYDENGELQASKVNLTKTTTYKNGKIKLTFKRLKLSDGKKITSYQVYRSTSKKFNKNLKKYSIKRTANTKSYTWTNSKKLKKGTKYYYKVRGRVKLSDGTYAYTQWSKVKTAKCKKSR